MSAVAGGDEVDRLRETVRAARAARTTVEAPEVAPGVEDAYRVQRELFGHDLVGYKLGLLSRAKQEQMGLSQPIHGRLSRGDVVRAEPGRVTRLDVGSFIQPRFEPEPAAWLGRDVPPGADPGHALRSVDHFVLALDVLDSVWRDYRFRIGHVIADNASGGVAVCGSVPVHGVDGVLEVHLDGTRLGGGRVTDVGENLAWLAGATGGLRAGQVVLLGSPVPATPVVPGAVRVVGFGTEIEVGFR
ncbi:hypothetical protein AB0I60_01340 [Actinosynnema sp. NPDC050436]|uniref:2-keto-4-pentenoate hydratase n=1 Tax=Actinosynnema sp. NPDC050436 TaxID=3155659 RepID=UPI0033E4A2D6